MKFIYLIIGFLIFFKNLSAYEQISIQKKEYLKNYTDLINHINETVFLNQLSQKIETNLYNINFSNNQISFELDIEQLSNELYQSNLNHNLLLLECSLKENFYKFNQNFQKCPNFMIISFNQEKFIYLNYINNFYRIKKYDASDDPKEIWINLINQKNNFNEISISTKNYSKLVKYLGKTIKINSYDNDMVNVSFESYYLNRHIHFLLNFF